MLPPSWKTEIQKAVQEETDSTKEGKECQPNDQSSPIAAQIQTFNDAYKTESQQANRREQTKRVIDVVTIVLLIATTSFTGLSWCAFRDQLHVFEKSDATLKETLDAQKKSSERQLRAYVIFVDAITQLKSGSPIIATYTIKNVGQTPVYDLRQKLFIGVRKPPVIDYSGIHWTDIHSVPYFSPLLTISKIEGPNIAPDDFEAVKRANLQNSEKRVYFIGRATYRDVFNNERWSDFCFMFFGESERSGCEYLNEADHESAKRRPD